MPRTFQDMINETRNNLMTEEPERLNLLETGVAANATTIQLSNEIVGVGAGAIICIDLECYQVVTDPSSTTPGSNIEVIPGVRGSKSAAHDAGALVYINPEFSDFRIAQQLNHCITALEGHDLYWINRFEFDFNPSQAGYELTPSDFISVWRVNMDVPGPANSWPVLMQEDFFVDLAANLSEFPSGKQLVLRRPASPGNTVKVAYRARFSPFDLDPFDPDVDVETATHLPDPAHDIPPLGAAMRILFGGEVKRVSTKRQPEPRRQEEVPPGSIRNANLPLIQAYYQAIDREVHRLNVLYPPQTH